MNLKFWEKRATLQDPKIPISSPNVIEVLGGAFGVGTTASKINVTPESAKGFSAVYAAIRLLSETIAQLPLVMYERVENGQQPAYSHPLYGLLHDEPNEESTSFVWRETMQSHVLGHGNGYSFISRGVSSNQPLSIEVLRPDLTRAERNSAGKLVYITIINGKEYEIDPADMLHVPAMGFDGLSGYSPLRLHAETIGLGLAATKFGAEFFGNGASLGGVLEVEGGLGDEARARLKTSWESLKGSGYQGVAVLEEGMKYNRIGIPPEDAQFLQTRKFQITEIARIYNVPPHMLRDLEKSSFNNIVEQSIEFLRYTMTPWLVKWEQELNRKLLTKQERQRYFLKFNVGGLLRGTQKDRYESYSSGINSGFLSRNEVRKLEDLNTVDGLDDYLVPLNMATEGSDPESNARGISHLVPVVNRASEAISTWFNKVNDTAKGNADDLALRLAGGMDDAISRHITPVIESICLVTGEDPAEKESQFRSWVYSQPAFESIEQQEIFEELMQ